MADEDVGTGDEGGAGEEDQGLPDTSILSPEGEDDTSTEGDGAADEEGEGDAEGKEGGDGEEEDPKPTEYEEFKVPEGYKIDDGVLGKAHTTFNDLGLDQDQAQKAVDLFSEIQQDTLKAQQEAFVAQQETWAKELLADPDIGGDKLEATTVAVRKVFNKYGDDSLRDLVKNYGIDSHPGMFRLLAKISHDVLEDDPDLTTGEGGKGKQGILTRWYED